MAKSEIGTAVEQVRASSAKKERARFARLEAETEVRVTEQELENATRVWARSEEGKYLGTNPTPELLAFFQNYCAAIRREEAARTHERAATEEKDKAQAELLKAAGLR